MRIKKLTFIPYVGRKGETKITLIAFVKFNNNTSSMEIRLFD